MKQAILLLPLLVLALVAPAAAEETPLEKQLGKQIEEVEAHLQAAALALRSAKDPEEQKKLTQEIQAHHQHLATLHARRETLRLQQALAERLDFVRADLKVDEVSPATAVALLAGPLEIDAIVDSKADAKPITLDLKYVTLREAFETIAKTAGLEMRLDGKVVRLERPRRVPPVQPKAYASAVGIWPLTTTRSRKPHRGPGLARTTMLGRPRTDGQLTDARRRVLSNRASLRIEKLPLLTLLSQLTENHDLSILLPTASGSTPITLDVSDATLADVLHRIARQAHLNMTVVEPDLVRLVPSADDYLAVQLVPPVPGPAAGSSLEELRSEIRTLRAEIAEIKAILLRSR